MSEVKVYKKRESILYAGFKPEGAPDFYEVEYVLKSDYDALKAKLEKAESVISFYANKRHWDYTRIQKVEDMEMHGFGNLGGRRAREYMKGEG